MLRSQNKLATIRRTEFLHKQITGIPNIAKLKSWFSDSPDIGISKKKSDRNLWNQKWNRNSAYNGGPRNWNQKLEFPTKSRCGWAYGFTFTPLPPQTLPQVCESWLKSYLMQICKPYHYMAIEPFRLHPMSMSYIYEVFEHLLRMWMGIWLHIHTITTTDTSPDMGKLAEIQPNASVQTMPLHFGWGDRTFQTSSHVHAIHI